MQHSKHSLRKIAYSKRHAQPGKGAASQTIVQRLINTEAYRQAQTVMCYLHCRSEVQTGDLIQRAMQDGKRVIIPYCTEDEQGNRVLGLWPFGGFEELQAGMWDIQEPPREQWQDKEKQVYPDELDVIMVPGVAFSSDGARLGNGAGYYDRLLHQVNAQCHLIGIAYECQIFPEIPMAAHDIYMHAVITEKTLYSNSIE